MTSLRRSPVSIGMSMSLRWVRLYWERPGTNSFMENGHIRGLGEAMGSNRIRRMRRGSIDVGIALRLS